MLVSSERNNTLCRMILVYTSLANSSRVGVRYAIVHGSTNTGTGTSGPSGPGSTVEIENVVNVYAQVALIDLSRLTISVTYPEGGANAPGSRVRVEVMYPYDPFVLLPLDVWLASATEGVITF